MTGPRPSLAARLYGRLLLLVAAVSLIMAVTVFHVARVQIKREADAQLITAADVLYALMEEELSGELAPDKRPLAATGNLLSREDIHAFRRSASWRMFAISRDGREVLRSDTAPPRSVLPTTPGLRTVQTDGATWRIYSLAVPHDHLLIQVGEHRTVRDTLIWQVAGALVLPILLLILGSAGLLWFALNGGLFELRRLVGTLGRRQPRDTHRFDVADWPRDLAPLVVALNDLFHRVEAAITRERQFTDDAAHQLRTPLAALRLQLQSLPRIRDDRARADLAIEMIAAIDRASLLVSQMLTLARLDADPPQSQSIDVAAVIEEEMADQAVVAARREMTLDFDNRAGRPMIQGDATPLRLALSNLIENAIKYGPKTTVVTVRLDGDGDRLRVAVIDRGAGILPGDRQAVRQRFHRGASDRPGAGLGLAIVSSAIDLLGGRLEFADRPDDSSFEAVLILPRGVIGAG